MDINFSNILLDKQLNENVSVYGIHTKLQWVQNHCVLGLIKQMNLIGFKVVNLDI